MIMMDLILMKISDEISDEVVSKNVETRFEDKII